MGNKPYQNRDTLIELYYDNGLSLYEIGDKFGVSNETIRRWMENHGIDRTKTSAEELTDESWLREQYHGKGRSSTDIASELGCTHRTVLNWMEKHGIKRRARNERPDELKDKESLRELYIEQDLSGYEIADKLGCNQKAVYRWLNKHGLEKTPKPHRRGKDNPRYRGGNRDYGDAWRAIRRDIRDRDGACQSCGITRERCKDKYGEDLHVHHVIPAREFDDKELQNDPKNLVSLCRDCHARWEGIPVKPLLTD